MNLAPAESSPGVIAIVTAANAGKLGQGKYNTARLLGGPEIQHYHQAVALVVAETFEQARAAAERLEITYTSTDGAFDLASSRGSAVEPKEQMEDTLHGDFETAFAAAPVQLDATYTTPDQAHAMMEPMASMAAWDGDRLTLWTSNQMIDWSVADLATTLGIPKKNVRLISPYIGGGFGGKLFIRADALPGRPGGAHGRQTGQSGAGPAADLQQLHPPPGDHPTPAHRCRQRRQDQRHGPRRLVR